MQSERRGARRSTTGLGLALAVDFDARQADVHLANRAYLASHGLDRSPERVGASVTLVPPMDRSLVGASVPDRLARCAPGRPTRRPLTGRRGIAERTCDGAESQRVHGAARIALD